jgi:hypothetical protein
MSDQPIGLSAEQQSLTELPKPANWNDKSPSWMRSPLPFTYQFVNPAFHGMHGFLSSQSASGHGKDKLFSYPSSQFEGLKHQKAGDLKDGFFYAQSSWLASGQESSFGHVNAPPKRKHMMQKGGSTMPLKLPYELKLHSSKGSGNQAEIRLQPNLGKNL